MKTLDAKTTILRWRCGTDQVELTPWPVPGSWREGGYDRSDMLACSPKVRAWTPDQRSAFILATALQLIVRDGCAPFAVHNAMLQLKEYRDWLSEDSGKPMPKGGSVLRWEKVGEKWAPQYVSHEEPLPPRGT